MTIELNLISKHCGHYYDENYYSNLPHETHHHT